MVALPPLVELDGGIPFGCPAMASVDVPRLRRLVYAEVFNGTAEPTFDNIGRFPLRDALVGSVYELLDAGISEIAGRIISSGGIGHAKRHSGKEKRDNVPCLLLAHLCVFPTTCRNGSNAKKYGQAHILLFR